MLGKNSCMSKEHYKRDSLGVLLHIMAIQDEGRLVNYNPSWLSCFTKSPGLSGSELHVDEKLKDVEVLSSSDAVLNKKQQQQPGGWKTLPLILGNETFERLATVGLMSNFMVYLMKVFHMDQVSASNVLNLWSGVSNFTPLVGAFISDAYAGKFKTIAFGSFALLLGMAIITLTAWVPGLHPPHCTLEHLQNGQCVKHNSSQLGILIMGLCFLSVGTSTIRPCSIPFGVDQFDPTTKEGQKGISSFFNWYYATFTVIGMTSMTLVVYIQDSVSWVLGFAIPTILMVCSIILFFVGTKLYIHVKPEGSVFSGIARVIVASYKKRGLTLPPSHCNIEGVYYDPPLTGSNISEKLPLTNQYRFLNKAAMILDGEVKPDGTTRVNKWRIASIQQVEEVKCLIRVIPVWASCILSFTVIIQQATFSLSQALKMDRHLGPKFEVPAGSMGVITMITIAIFIPIYDRILVPLARKVTKHEGGITMLQRIGTGIVFSVLSLAAAGLVERKRRESAVMHPQGPPLSVWWLAPQLILMGFNELLNILGQLEFLNKQFPDHMRSVANSIFSVSFALASYTSALVVNIVHHGTGKRGHPDWLTRDINAGKLDYFYYLIAGMGVVNFFYFLYVAGKYRYKANVWIKTELDKDIEVNTIKLETK